MSGLCEICGREYASERHHLIFGIPNRRRCDDDGIVLECCQRCHKEIHYRGTSEHLSKMLGQALWEINALNDGIDKFEVRDRFRERYGRSWL